METDLSVNEWDEKHFPNLRGLVHALIYSRFLLYHLWKRIGPLKKERKKKKNVLSSSVAIYIQFKYDMCILKLNTYYNFCINSYS